MLISKIIFLILDLYYNNINLKKSTNHLIIELLIYIFLPL